MPLRDYQARLLDDIDTHLDNGASGVMAYMPTGAGKTYTALSSIAHATARGERSLVVVHRDELLHQWAAAAAGLNIPFGLTAASVGKRTTDPAAPLQIAMIDTLNRRTTAFTDITFDWLHIDEAHLGSANKYDKLRSRLPETRIIGWSATPWRLDNKGFPWCQALALGPAYEALEQRGALVPFTVYSIDKLNYSGLRKKFGEYTASSQAEQFNTQPLIGSVVAEYMKHAFCRTGLVFATTVEHSKALCAEFLASGIPAAHIDGTTPRHERTHVLEQLANEDIWIVCNVGVLIEGLNITSISYIGCAFATASLAKWIQCAGRALRPSLGKVDAIICDHGGNARRHGSLDYQHKWSITPRVKAKRTTDETTIRARICTTCNAVYPLTIDACPVCGSEHIIAPRAPKTQKGSLHKLARGSGPVRRQRRGPPARVIEQRVDTWLSSFRY